MILRNLRLSQVWLPILCIVLATAAAFTTGDAKDRATAGVATELAAASETGSAAASPSGTDTTHHAPAPDYWPLLFVFLLATFIGVGVIQRVSRLLHTPLMSITNAISAIAVVGSIIVTGSDYPLEIRIMGAVALFASTTNIVSGFLITDRMLKMFKTPGKGQAP